MLEWGLCVCQIVPLQHLLQSSLWYLDYIQLICHFHFRQSVFLLRHLLPFQNSPTRYCATYELWKEQIVHCHSEFIPGYRKRKHVRSLFNEDIHPHYLKMSPFIVAYEQTLAMDVWNALEITCWVFLMSLLVAYLGRVLKSPSQISPMLLWCWRKHPAVVQQSPRPGT